MSRLVFTPVQSPIPHLSGAGQQILSELGMSQTTSNMGMAYAMAYPFGICGILLSMWLIRLFFKIKVDEEAANFEKESGHDKEALKSISPKKSPITNLNGIHLIEIPGF